MEKYLAPLGKLTYIDAMNGIEEVYARVLYAVNGQKAAPVVVEEKINVMIEKVDQVCPLCLEKGQIEEQLKKL